MNQTPPLKQGSHSAFGADSCETIARDAGGDSWTLSLCHDQNNHPLRLPPLACGAAHKIIDPPTTRIMRGGAAKGLSRRRRCSTG